MGREGFLDEFRGQSSPIGGDPGAITFANFLRHFNPNVTGFSVGRHFVDLDFMVGHNERLFSFTCQSKYGIELFLSFFLFFFFFQPHLFPDKDVLNGALSGATADELVSQVEYEAAFFFFF
jgi:phospholipase B1